jgi:hypothetical protein
MLEQSLQHKDQIRPVSQKHNTDLTPEEYCSQSFAALSVSFAIHPITSGAKQCK